jgi:hypothetical protein
LLYQPLLFPPEVKVEAGASQNEKSGRFRGENLHFRREMEQGGGLAWRERGVWWDGKVSESEWTYPNSRLVLGRIGVVG